MNLISLATILLIIIIIIIIIIITRPCAALQAAGLDWIVRPYYSLGWVHFERKYNCLSWLFRVDMNFKTDKENFSTLPIEKLT